MSGFVYRPRTVEDVQQRQQEVGNDSPGVVMSQYKVYVPPKGDNWIRILPATWENSRHWSFDTWVHFAAGPDRGSVVMCNNRMGQGQCYGCELRVQAERAGAEEEAKQLAPRRRGACWLIDRNAEEEGPQIWLMPSGLDDEIQSVSIDKTDNQLYLVDNPTNGYDVTFVKTGEKLNTRYTAPQIARRPSPVHPSYINYVATNPIPNCLIWRTYEEMVEIYTGGMGPEAAAPPARNFGRGAPATAPARTPPATRGPAPGYPPSGGMAGPPTTMPQRRAFGRPGAAPPATMGPGRTLPPNGPIPQDDHYRGEQYAVDPNYPPPQDGYDNSTDPNNPPPWEPWDGPPPDDYGAPQGDYSYDPTQQEYREPEPPPYNNAPNAVNYRNPPAQQYTPPSTAPTIARRPLPQQQQYTPPQQQQYTPPQQQYAPPQQQRYTPPQPQHQAPTTPPRSTYPGRGAPPQQQQPQRSGTAPEQVAAELRSRYPQNR